MNPLPVTRCNLIGSLKLLLTLVLTFGICRDCFAQEDSIAEDGPWISSLSWTDPGNIVGTKSQGLLLRPAELIRANAQAPQETETIAKSDTSLWSVLSVGSRTIRHNELQRRNLFSRARGAN